MLYLKERPAGVDIPIQKLQRHLYGVLLKAWDIDSSQYSSFCRIYKNQAKEGYIPEFYMGNGEYRETFFDDRVAVTSFFSVGDKVKLKDGRMIAEVSLIFCLNLGALNRRRKTDHRTDEEVRLDVLEQCNYFGFSVDSYETGLDRVFREFNQKSIKFNDIHPKHCFRINMNADYGRC